MAKGKRCASRRKRRSPVLPILLTLALVVGAAALVLPRVLTGDEEIPPAVDGETEGTAQGGGQQGADEGAETDPEPAQPPEPEPTLAETTLEGMTLYEKVCQLFIVFPRDITGVSQVVAAGETTRKALEEYPVGGFIYDKSSMQSIEQVTTMLETTQTFVKIPMIFTCDEEGGRVNRLMSTVGTTWVGPMLDYKEEGTDKAAENALTIAKDLAACGFNTDLAPVADVWSNPDNTVIGDRAYSDDYEEAAELVAAAVAGFHEGGVACTLKHFPGHGDTSADSHYGSVYIYKSMDEIRAEELLPFKAGIEAGADAVMMGHLIVTDVDEDLPAVFSYEMVTEILRGELGFDGVVMTDALQMQAMTDHYSSGEIAVKAVKAGVDMLLCPLDLDAAVEALLAAVESGEITEERINESVLRILTLKENRGILTE